MVYDLFQERYLMKCHLLDSYRRSDNIGAINIVDRPDSANVTWFRSKDYDRSGAISFQVSWISKHNTIW